MLKLRRTFAILSKNPLAFYFLLSIGLVDIVNETGRIVISGKGSHYSLSFLYCFLLCGRNVLCAIHEGAYDRVFMLGMVV